MRDRETQRSRGFGFVTYGNEVEAQAAIQQMNDADLDGRRIRVNIANARGGGGGGGGGGPSKFLFIRTEL
jgi:RNA recognition motif-containing protein